ncbi:quinone-dependent dihydroorotate dehydrogenase [bacterium]|nr:MAG: quinone-dependent dihydroorotate dehydrogenase [bacterium]
MYKKLIRPLLFQFDSESVHDFILNRLDHNGAFLSYFKKSFQVNDPILNQSIFNRHFPNPIGLAAGFDKYAKAIPAWNYLGFGFAEIGTVTGQEQSGNERPRLFRLKKDQALINRFGFNNAGALKTSTALELWKIKNLLHAIPLGINIGKTKVVELEKAKEDYLLSFETLWTYGDYFVVNVSSPNTPNLRELQDKSFLTDIIQILTESNSRLSKISGQLPKPILVKIAPDLNLSQIDDVLQVIESTKISGIVATNTTIERNNLRSDPHLSKEAGGLSGKPLKKRSTEIVRHIYASTQGKILIIGVGGIFTGDDAFEKIKAGASLLQIYTGFIYEGPMVCKKINKRLIELVKRDGFKNITAVVGKE